MYDTGPAGLAAWRAFAMPLLTADPIRNTIALTALAEHDMPRPGPRIVTLLTVDGPDGRTVAAAVRFDGYCLQVCAVPPECADAVSDALAADEPLWRRGVFGAAGSVDALVRARTDRTGERAVPDVEMRLWKLGTLVAPRGVPGTPRPAEAGDAALVAAWSRAFAADVPNRIYARIGFEPGGLHREMRFEPATDSARA